MPRGRPEEDDLPPHILIRSPIEEGRAGGGGGGCFRREDRLQAQLLRLLPYFFQEERTRAEEPDGPCADDGQAGEGSGDIMEECSLEFFVCRAEPLCLLLRGTCAERWAETGFRNDDGGAAA